MQSLARAKYSRRRDPEETQFKQLIQRDPDICNNCFRLTHISEQRNVAVDSYRDGNESKIWLREVDLPNRSWPRPSETEFTQSDTVTGGTYRGCTCGVSSTTVRPVSKDLAMSHVDRLLARLEEKQFDFETDTIRQMAWSMLSKPEWQGKQDDLFGELVKFATHEQDS